MPNKQYLLEVEKKQVKLCLTVTSRQFQQNIAVVEFMTKSEFVYAHGT